ncbi:glycoside hydrolase family 28 protein [Lophiostoma macrostomum CBS 122681]|uniref:endo-polygalacturonase n=1 Tax=Lophiostoma macrostomum CBS 122681 TaxID=1314788 RepID=A0A6A6THY6_9PLEO|nr:glycoside hydrolase family 28 protein [Lophiostoma macrostomum CBS 122681]
MISFSSALLVALAAVATASPVAQPEITPAPRPALGKRASSCTFSGSLGYSSASKSQTACSTIVLSALAVPSGKALDLSDLPDDTSVIFEGKTTFAYAEWAGPLMQIEGTGIKISGASGAVIDGNGAKYWDGEGGSGGVTKPKFFAAHNLISSSITNLYIQNTPVQAVSIAGADGLTITDMTIDNSDGDSLGKNTDGFDIGTSSNVIIDGAKVYNQDDCVAINSGTDITFENGLCSGGHGLSIGSVGGRSDNTVDTVTFYNSEVTSSVNGIRIKGIEDETGTIKGVTYNKITLSDISKYGILIEQNYDGGDLDGGTASSGVPITDLTIENITGSGAVSSSGYDVVITCGSGACSGWTWSNVVVTGGKTYSKCTNVPSVTSCS